MNYTLHLSEVTVPLVPIVSCKDYVLVTFASLIPSDLELRSLSGLAARDPD